jgi:hypothetical protein
MVAFDQQGVSFKWKNYRVEGRDRYQRMTLETDEFIRRFLIHVLAYTASATTACSPKTLTPTTSSARVSRSPLQNLKPPPAAPKSP